MNKKLLSFLAVGLGCFSIASGTKALTTDELQAKLDSIAPNGVLDMKAVKPKTEAQDFFTKDFFLRSFTTSQYYLELVDCNEENTTCDLGIQMQDGSNGLGTSVTLKWSEESDVAKEAIAKAKQEFLSNYNQVIRMDGLEKIAYIKSNINEFATGFARYSKEFKSLISVPKVAAELSLQAGGTEVLSEGFQCGVIFTYDGIIYDYLEQDANQNQYFLISSTNIVYIPENTENTSEAFIAAAKKRIDALLGKNDITISAKPISNLKTDFEMEEFNITDYIEDASKAGDYYYLVKINNEEHPFLIVKDDSKINITTTKDETTGIEIVTTDPSVPSDTKVIVNEIKKDTDIHKTIANTLKIKEFKAFDISLYSESLKDNIKKLENGIFQVTIPLGREYVGKNLSAYYITDTKIEEHKISLDENGNATFETDHFSTYIIAEAGLTLNGELVPKTYDPIKAVLVTGVMGLIGFGCSALYLKKSKQN